MSQITAIGNGRTVVSKVKDLFCTDKLLPAFVFYYYFDMLASLAMCVCDYFYICVGFGSVLT